MVSELKRKQPSNIMSTGEVISTAIILGTVHVLTGPDHLSALATLSGTDISASRGSSLASFLLGIKWGVGHSLGLLVVGGILIAVKEEVGVDENGELIGMNPTAAMLMEAFVGIFMLALGFYGLRRAFWHMEGNIDMNMSAGSIESNKLTGEGGHMDKPFPVDVIEMPRHPQRGRDRDCDSVQSSIIGRMEQLLEYDDEDDDEEYQEDYVEPIHGVEDAAEEDIDQLIYQAAGVSKEDHKKQRGTSFIPLKTAGGLSKSFRKILNNKPKRMNAKSFVMKHATPGNSIVGTYHGSESSAYKGFMARCCFLCATPGILALITGVVHGVAGPGGILGVILAFQLRDAKLATTHLTVFCLTSTLVMGGFAACYGRFTEYLAGGGRVGRGTGSNMNINNRRRVFWIEVGSAFFSILVGVVWLLILLTGEFDEVRKLEEEDIYQPGVGMPDNMYRPR